MFVQANPEACARLWGTAGRSPVNPGASADYPGHDRARFYGAALKPGNLANQVVGGPAGRRWALW